MATNNQVNVGLSGSTGTGSFVGSASPALTGTPTLGGITLLSSKVVQWVEASSSSDDATSSGTMVDSSLTASITPTSTSNFILVFVSCYAVTTNPGGNNIQNMATGLNIRRSSGTPADLSGAGKIGLTFPAASTSINMSAYGQTTLIGYEQAPATSAQTYVLQYDALSTSSTATIKGSTAKGYMILMELRT